MPSLTIMEKLGPYVALSVKRKCAPGPGWVFISTSRVSRFLLVMLRTAFERRKAGLSLKKQELLINASGLRRGISFFNFEFVT